MKIKWEFIVIIALLLLIIAGIIFWPKPPEFEGIKNARDSIERITMANTILAMEQRTLELNLAEVKAKATSDSARFYREITVKNQQLAKKRIKIDTLILENPNLASYMQTADSVFAMMRERIDTLEADKQFQEGLFSQMIYIKDKQIANLEIVSSQKDIVIKDLEKQARKKRRGNRLLKIGVIALPVLALIGGSQL